MYGNFDYASPVINHDYTTHKIGPILRQTSFLVGNRIIYRQGIFMFF